jgi:hypothetical protein
MIRFENTEVFNLDGAVRGTRNSWESWDKSDSRWFESDRWYFELGEADRKLALTLSKAGSDHGKYLRQILVSVDIIAPEKWWSEMDTYKVGTVANSTSMMHTLGKARIQGESFSFENVDDDLFDNYMTLINEARDRWVDTGKKKPSREWRQMIMLMAVGFNYRRTFTTNYQMLKNAYHSRRNHRLSEWHIFADWVESLPYSELITLKDKE